MMSDAKAAGASVVNDRNIAAVICTGKEKGGSYP